MNVTTREALSGWLDTLMERYDVIAPTHTAGHPPGNQELLYERVLSSADICFDFERTTLPSKTFFLPDTEVLLYIERQERDVSLREPVTERPQVLFAPRPCDVQGLLALDALLLDRAPADALYAARRERTTLVVLACPRLWDGCFCTSLGSAPDDKTGADIMLYGYEAHYRVLAVTDKGSDLLEGLQTEQKEGLEPVEPSSESYAQGHVPVLAPEVWESLFEHSYWNRLADRCLSCHACTYVCPTCRCFDIRDRTLVSDAGYAHIQRLRAWDSCMAPAYRRIAGGHNPRPTKAQRLRNRYYCKFHYSPVDFGAVACVGCGRCIEVCPVGIDIAEMLADLHALAENRTVSRRDPSGDEGGVCEQS